MVYLFALAAGLFTAALLVGAGLSGYAIAHLPRNRAPLFALAAGSAMIVCATSAVLGSITYAKLSAAPVTRTAANRSPAPSASPSPDSTPAASDQYIAATDGWMHFQSPSGDYIGGGMVKVWTITESNFSVEGDQDYLRFTASGQGDSFWLDFRAPSNGHLRVGEFDNAERAPFVTGKAPGIEISGDGRGCNTLSGRFEIKTLTWGETGILAQVDIVFEQHCEGRMPPLLGELWLTTESGVHKPAPQASASVTF